MILSDHATLSGTVWEHSFKILVSAQRVSSGARRLARGSGVRMPARVLFLCAQNICRSPLMAAAFVGAMSGDLTVVSAGVRAHEGGPVCELAAQIVPALAGHRSAVLSPGDIDAADIVITASLAERASVARLRPHARTKTFTLREALLLAESDIAAVTSLAEYAASLDGERGTLDLVGPSRLPWRRASASPLDVADVHGSGTRVHRGGLERAARDAALLAQNIRRRLVLVGN
ncbi:hypothetical protein [Microbacterium sp.]|uniref:arsenate reductase/protein-tyrosine-phosphatase family protein n=1 Tax=Microbacterium sp. TaxID=51671 RepID=UPI003A9005E6